MIETKFIQKSIATSLTVSSVIVIGNIIEYHLEKKLKETHPIHLILIRGVINIFVIFIVSMIVLILLRYFFGFPK